MALTGWKGSAQGRTLMLLAVLLLAGAAEARPRQQRSEGEPGRFDYYAVALSWSPAFCATHDDPDQCAPGRQAGFVLHGLWPQYERGLSAKLLERTPVGARHRPLRAPVPVA